MRKSTAAAVLAVLAVASSSAVVALARFSGDGTMSTPARAAGTSAHAVGPGGQTGGGGAGARQGPGTPARTGGAMPASGAPWTPDPAVFGVAEKHNVPVAMSDGVVLRVDVYTPTNPSTGLVAPGPFPALLTQTPYGKGTEGADTYFVQRGYIEVVADVRGTGDSGGSYGLFDPVQAHDGAQLVGWSAGLPHADGEVGLFGESYLGINQFLTVGALPRESPVKAIFPVISANDVYRDTAFDGGLFDGEFSSIYTGLEVGVQNSDPFLESAQAPSSGAVADLPQVQTAHIGSLGTYYAPSAADVALGGPETYDERYWLDRSPISDLSAVVADRIPAFLVGGWYDLFQHGEPLNYVALQNLYDGRPASAAMTADQPITGRYQLLMGPWYHLTAGAGFDLDRLELEWFDTWLKHEPTGMAQTTTPLHMNVLGTSRYVDLSGWPTGAAQASTLWLVRGGALSTSAPTAPTGDEPIVFTGLSAPCDRETSQWMMGADNVASSDAGIGADPCTNADNDVQLGPGSLAFTSAPMAADTVVAGPMDVSIAATDTAKDAEWVANVEDVTPSGRSVPLTSGALLGSMRAVDGSRSWAGPGDRLLLPWHPFSSRSAQAVVPGAVTRYEVEVFPTLAEIPKGDSLRVTISTSDTPHLLPTPGQLANLAGGTYDVELNAATPSYLDAVLLPASQLARPCALCAQAAR